MNRITKTSGKTPWTVDALLARSASAVPSAPNPMPARVAALAIPTCFKLRTINTRRFVEEVKMFLDIYNQSLVASMIHNDGEEKAQAWCNGIVANMARAPKGGDTDQIKAVGAGECQVAVSNSYYIARLMRSTKPEDQALMEKVGIVFPNQNSWGTHVNIAGGAMASGAPACADRPEPAGRPAPGRPAAAP